MTFTVLRLLLEVMVNKLTSGLYRSKQTSGGVETVISNDSQCIATTDETWLKIVLK